MGGMGMGIRLSMNSGFSGESGGATAFSPLSLSPTAWYDPSDLTSMFQDSSGTTPAVVDQPVGKLNDKSGNGRHLLQTTTASKPVLRSSVGLYWLEFDGVDDSLRSATFGSIAGPFDRVSALKVATWVSPGVLFDAATNAMLLFQTGSSPSVTMHSFGTSVGSANLALNTATRTTERFNGASSSLNINGTGVTGTAGAAAITELILGAQTSGPATTQFPSTLLFYGQTIRQGTLDASQLAALESYTAAKVGA